MILILGVLCFVVVPGLVWSYEVQKRDAQWYIDHPDDPWANDYDPDGKFRHLCAKESGVSLWG